MDTSTDHIPNSSYVNLLDTMDPMDYWTKWTHGPYGPHDEPQGTLGPAVPPGHPGSSRPIGIQNQTDSTHDPIELLDPLNLFNLDPMDSLILLSY